MFSLSALPNAILFAFTGIAVFAAVAIFLFHSPLAALWRRATLESDTSASLVVAALLLALAFIIGSAVH